MNHRVNHIIKNRNLQAARQASPVHLGHDHTRAQEADPAAVLPGQAGRIAGVSLIAGRAATPSSR